jgi:anti-sigma-K factor RskA
VTEHQELREQLGAYVLGQLDLATRTALETHLADCASCRAEVAELEPVVAALDVLGPARFDAPAPPAELEHQLLDEVGHRRRAAVRRDRVRRVGGTALVAASVAAAFAAGTWYAGPRTDPPVIPVVMTLDQPGLTVDAGLVRHTWGTELKLEATGLRDGQSYAVTFLADDGSRVSAGSFLGTGTRPVRCSVNAAIPVDAATRLEVTDPRGQLVMDADLG